jgi:hypothetical protein
MCSHVLSPPPASVHVTSSPCLYEPAPYRFSYASLLESSLFVVLYLAKGIMNTLWKCFELFLCITSSFYYSVHNSRLSNPSWAPILSAQPNEATAFCLGPCRLVVAGSWTHGRAPLICSSLRELSPALPEAYCVNTIQFVYFCPIAYLLMEDGIVLN